jgi:dihydroorotate dehydrogenase (NAD+) catalytic subunit
MEKLETKIGKIHMKSPLMIVSGIYGTDYELLLPGPRYVGAVVTKSITLQPRAGNPTPRVIETKAGILNAVGLQNPGLDTFIKQEVPKLSKIKTPIIASIAGFSVKEYVECARRLSKIDRIEGLELNVSCPNVEKGGIEFGSNPGTLEEVVAKVRAVTREKTLITKLTPNVTDITAIAQASINGGTDAISLINTLRGMAIDIETQKPKLGNKIGGLSGIGIHPVAVYMIRQCYVTCCRRAGIPIIGIGGVTDCNDALEFILAGATAVGIGTGLFRDDGEESMFKIITRGMNNYLKRKKEVSLNALIGKAVM